MDSNGASTALSSQPLLSNEDTNAKPPSKRTFIVRPARLGDLKHLAVMNMKVYWGSAMNDFLFPGAAEHPEDMVRICLQRMRRGYVNPAIVSLVACPTDNPDIPVGNILALRAGKDEGTKRVEQEKGVMLRFWLWVLSWYFWVAHWLSNTIWKDRITDKKNMSTFLGEWGKRDREKYWSAPERQNLWVIQNLMVDPLYQGKGIGKLLMAEIIKRQEVEIPKIVMGLTSSPHGEYLYRRLGFELMGDFYARPPGETDFTGGLMIRYPEGWEGPRHEKYVGFYDRKLQGTHKLV